jgi:Kef-type K+ transport system membrane component KefB/nucleotide-binding universal stress UspA family protein
MENAPALSSEEVFARLMLSIAGVIIAARVVGIVVARLGQPRVMGEVLAGILLGPTLFGALSPAAFDLIFPTQIRPLLGGAADIGLAFYMFLVGLELDARLLAGRVRQAAIISNASVVVPMAIGIAVAIPLHETLAPTGIPLLPFALFLGVSMSITAFPVLARILVERNMLRHPIGAMALAAAAVDDVTAWGLLALASATATATVASGSEQLPPGLAIVRVVGLAVVFCVFMATVVRRGLSRLATAFEMAGQVPAVWVGLIFVGVLLAAGVAGSIGVAPIFGAFVMGLAMPRREALTRDVSRRLEDFVGIVLLPLFFAVAGLKANIFKIIDPTLIGLTLLLIGIAIGTKFLSAAAAARITGMGGRESLAIGALMNTRGLTELIVLTIARDRGIIDERLFTMLVIMALVTTFMAGPLLRLIDPGGALTTHPAENVVDDAAAAPAAPTAPKEHAIVVVALDSPNLADLLAIAEPLAGTEPNRELIAVSLLEPSPISTGVAELDRRHQEARKVLEGFRPGVTRSGIVYGTASLTSPHPARDLVRLAGNDRVDLILVDGRRPVFGGDILGEPVRSLLEEAPPDVAVLLGRPDRSVQSRPEQPIVVPFGGAEHDWAALELGSWLAKALGRSIRLLGAAEGERDPSRLLGNASVVLQQLTGLAAEIRIVDRSEAGLSEAVSDASFLVLGLSTRWREEGLGAVRTELAEKVPVPVLIVRRGSRPGVLAPRDELTRFSWSYTGGATPAAAAGLAQPGDQRMAGASESTASKDGSRGERG